MPTQKKQLNPVLLAVMGLLLGVLTFLLIYGKAPLDTGNDNWIFYGYDETDIRQDYAGWLGFRSSSWQFPLAQADSFAQPSTAGVNISFTDSLPLVSVLFKLFRAWQPVTFQWYGWYELFTYAMQGWAEALLLGMFVQSLAGAAAGTLLFTFSPVMMERAFRHPSLSSHYFVVFALYFYLRGRREKRCFTPAFWVLAAAGPAFCGQLRRRHGHGVSAGQRRQRVFGLPGWLRLLLHEPGFAAEPQVPGRVHLVPHAAHAADAVRPV